MSGSRTTLVWRRRRFCRDSCGERHLKVHPQFRAGLTRRFARRLVADARVMSIRAQASFRAHHTGTAARSTSSDHSMTVSVAAPGSTPSASISYDCRWRWSPSRIQCCPPIHYVDRILLEVGREFGCQICYCVVAKQALEPLPDLVHDDCCAGWEIHRFRISDRETAEIGAATSDRDSRRLTSIIVLCDRQPSDSTSGISTPPALALSFVENAPFVTRAFRGYLP